MRYAYDPAGNRTRLTTPAGTTQSAYDAANHLTAVTDPAGRTTSYTYDTLGLRSSRTLPNGVVTTYGYDVRQRLYGLNHVQSGTGTLLASYSYGLDAAGIRQSVSEADGSSTVWSYDASDRLLGETRLSPTWTPLGSTAYTYDAAGNRLTQTVDGTSTTTANYNQLDQLTTFGQLQYTYDGRGNLTRVTDGITTTTYRRDAQNHLVGVTLPTGVTLSYSYDADGRRVKQTVTDLTGTTTTNWVWDEASAYGDIVAEVDSSGGLQASYTLGGAELVSQQRGATTRHYLADGQGSVRSLTDPTGNVTDSYRYGPYGTLTERTGSTNNPFGYTGQQTDSGSGLLYLRARYYEPGNGRFLSRDTVAVDPIQPTDLHRYFYAGGSPTQYADPSGHLLVEYVINQTKGKERELALAGALASIYWAVLQRLNIRTMDMTLEDQDASGCRGKCLYHYTSAQSAGSIAASGLMFVTRKWGSHPRGVYATGIEPTRQGMTQDQLARLFYFAATRQRSADFTWYVELCNDRPPYFIPNPFGLTVL